MKHWLWSCNADTPTTAIATRLGFTNEPISEISARGWHVTEQVMDELVTSFPMPDYFGRNWNAVDECVRDLCDHGRLIVIRDIRDEGFENVARFVDCVGGMWQQEPQFHPEGKVAVVLEGYPDTTLTARWPNGEVQRHDVGELK